MADLLEAKGITVDVDELSKKLGTPVVLVSAIGTFIVSYLVSKFLARKIKNIDMVTSLKGNE